MTIPAQRSLEDEARRAAALIPVGLIESGVDGVEIRNTAVRVESATIIVDREVRFPPVLSVAIDFSHLLEEQGDEPGRAS